MSTLDLPESPATEMAPVDGPAVLAKVSRRLIPFLFLLYVVNYMDRTNISFTKEQMQASLQLTDKEYGLAAGIFFLTYTLFEVPSNIILQRVGARRWITRIIISWGLVAMAMALVKGAVSFSILRLLLGIAEAGFSPGIILYLTYWFPARERARAFGLFLTSIALSGVIGSPLSACLLKMEGMGGLHGWQWVFVLEGLVCLPLGVLAFCWLADRPHKARWLSAAESQWLEDQLSADAAASRHHVHTLLHACRDRHVLLLVIEYFTLMCGLFGFIFWAPSVMIDHTGGWLKSIPFLVAAIMMVVIGRHSDRTNERRWHVAGCAILGAVGMAATALCPNTPMAIVTLCIASIGIWGSLGPFWALPTAFLRGNAAAGGIAAVNAIGCTAGLVTPYVIGVIRQRTGGFGGLYFVAGMLTAGAILVLFIRVRDERAETPDDSLDAGALWTDLIVE